MSTLTRRQAVKGIVGLGLTAGSLLNTGASEKAASTMLDILLWNFFGDRDNKSRFFAMLEERKKDCEAQKLTDKEKQDATNNQIKMAVQAMGPKSGTARRVTAVPSAGVTTLTSTFAVAAVMPARNRVWVLNNYGDFRIRILGSDPVRLITDLPLPGNTATRGMVLSPDRSTAYVLRSRPSRARFRIWKRRSVFKLFDRLPRGVKISSAGKLFLEDAQRISSTGV